MPDEEVFPYGSNHDDDPVAQRIRRSNARLQEAALALAEATQRARQATPGGASQPEKRLQDLNLRTEAFLRAAARHNLVTLEAIPHVPAESEVLYEVYCYEHMTGHRLCEDHACDLRPKPEVYERARPWESGDA